MWITNFHIFYVDIYVNIEEKIFLILKNAVFNEFFLTYGEISYTIKMLFSEQREGGAIL